MRPSESQSDAWYLTEERVELRDLTRHSTNREVVPAANKLDPEHGDMPPDLIQTMATMGLFGILVPDEYGGLGLGAVEYCLVAEELARGWMSVASIIARGNGSASDAFSAEQKEAILPRVAAGDYLGAFALSEAEAGSDVANIQCAARRDGSDWVINGSKMWCTFADGTDYIVLFARTAPASNPRRRHEGISAFAIDKPRGQFPAGLTGTPIRKIGYFGWKTWDLFFDDLRLPGDALLGEEGRGFYAALGHLEIARVHTAARSIGLAQAALEDSIRYVKERRQFGRPIGDFQALRFKIATMAAQVESARALTYQAADDIDHGRQAGTKASMAKLIASEMAEQVTSEAMQIHGGAGYTQDFPIERYWRDARLTKIFEGTSEIQQRIISDDLLGRVHS